MINIQFGSDLGITNDDIEKISPQITFITSNADIEAIALVTQEGYQIAFSALAHSESLSGCLYSGPIPTLPIGKAAGKPISALGRLKENPALPYGDLFRFLFLFSRQEYCTRSCFTQSNPAIRCR